MRAAILVLVLSSAQAGVLSRDWDHGKLTLRLDDGTAEIDWISGTAFRFSRARAALPPLPRIAHDPVPLEFEDTRGTLTIRGRYITIEVDKPTARLRVSTSDQTIATLSIEPGVFGLTLHAGPLGRIYGLADSQRFFYTTGFGTFIRSPRQCTFDLENGMVRTPSPAIDVIFYYGPSPKEIFSQHQLVMGKTEIVSPLPTAPLDSWDALANLVHTLNQWSNSAVLYPSLDVSVLPVGHNEIAKRAADLAAILPLLSGDWQVVAPARDRWQPYLATYLREAYDRGYPVIRPLSFEFSRDKDIDPQPGVFMLGDEVLMAPVVVSGSHRTLHLPRGPWTDLRTNVEYNGNQDIDIEAPPGQVPTFARNGAVLPLAAKHAFELHYFPSLGGEFFLWEPDVKDNSQFHAAPAGDFTRVEIESKAARTYEWVIHHTKRPSAVEGFKPVRQRSALKPGTWWHDNARNDLHVMLHVEAGTDTIVNIAP
jgi:hypothetical protein